MCSRATCRRCGKATFSGCGEHIEEALQGVALAERCACAGAPVQGAAGVRTGLAPESGQGGSLLKRLFGR